MELTELESGSRRNVECDLVIFTADWIPDHELAVMAGCDLDSGSLGPLVDQALRTTTPGVFAAGNLLHPAETADICALDGRHVAASVAAYQRGAREWPARTRVVARDPIAWVAPGLLVSAGHGPPRNRFLLRSTEFLRRARIRVRQDGRQLWRGRVGRLVPGRSAHIPSAWTRCRRSSWRPRDRRSRVARIAPGRIGWSHERRDVARHRRGNDRGEGRALRPAAAAAG